MSLLPVSAYLPDCGGDFSLEKGIKECSACIVPHSEEGYDYILEAVTGKLWRK